MDPYFELVLGMKINYHKSEIIPMNLGLEELEIKTTRKARNIAGPISRVVVL